MRFKTLFLSIGRNWEQIVEYWRHVFVSKHYGFKASNLDCNIVRMICLDQRNTVIFVYYPLLHRLRSLNLGKWRDRSIQNSVRIASLDKNDQIEWSRRCVIYWRYLLNIMDHCQLMIWSIQETMQHELCCTLYGCQWKWFESINGLFFCFFDFIF